MEGVRKQKEGENEREGGRLLGGCVDELAKGGGKGVQKSANGKVCTSLCTGSCQRRIWG